MIPLPPDLVEISGIAYYDENSLVGVEDNHGLIYKLNFLSGRITGKYKFAKNNDYEDLAVVKDSVYVMNSRGNIYQVTDLGEKRDARFKSAADDVVDAEGLCYDEKSGALLVAFKKVKGDYKHENEKPIFAFDLATGKFKPDPMLTMNFDTYRQTSGIKVDAKTFRPSGIAIHPLSGDIYLISNVSKQLMVITRNGDLIALVTLGFEIFRQPEGICFLPNGDMFISSEGKKSAYGYLLFFPYNVK